MKVFNLAVSQLIVLLIITPCALADHEYKLYKYDSSKPATYAFCRQVYSDFAAYYEGLLKAESTKIEQEHKDDVNFKNQFEAWRDIFLYSWLDQVRDLCEHEVPRHVTVGDFWKALGASEQSQANSENLSPPEKR